VKRHRRQITTFRAEQTLVPRVFKCAPLNLPHCAIANSFGSFETHAANRQRTEGGAIVGDFLSFLHDAGHVLEPYIHHYGLPALFVIVYREALGAPVPGESALVASSLLAANGEFSMWALVAVVWAAVVLGDSTGYAIGRFGGRPLLLKYGWLVKLTPERLAHFEELFRRRGPLIVVGARFALTLTCRQRIPAQ
jgi:membrane protein YqaA with SNARE-associated domain